MQGVHPPCCFFLVLYATWISDNTDSSYIYIITVIEIIKPIPLKEE